jgi:coproporphyrinogen III oxidase
MWRAVVLAALCGGDVERMAARGEEVEAGALYRCRMVGNGLCRVWDAYNGRGGGYFQQNLDGEAETEGEAEINSKIIGEEWAEKAAQSRQAALGAKVYACGVSRA